MNSFVFSSEEFQREVRESAHHAGQVEFLQSLLRPGMHVIEAGANRGVTAVAIAKEIGREGHLYAFEPVPQFYAELKENLLRNDAENVSTHQLAVGDRRGRIPFYKHGGGSGVTRAEDAEVLSVETTTVTDFLVEQGEDRIDFLNLDCEGSELLVLEGARPVLEEQAPQIFCELHRGYLGELDQSADDVVGFLTELGYEVRPLQVENLGGETDVEKCSHVYARRPADEHSVEELEEKIADLKARIPIHSVRPAMMQELEELEDQLRAAQKGRRT